MPTYDYKCEKCGHQFSRIETIAAHERSKVTCPKCRAATVTRVFSAFYAKTVRKS